MTVIVRIYRIGHPRQHRVALACGHKFTVADEELRQHRVAQAFGYNHMFTVAGRQWYLGKRVTCLECGK
ncbi:MAG: hypothetical protein C5B60_09140 [Chloroflexi bacterium]|nr:MAG: hypothetical protein C5B60_09140 [Chloroflexota bacterium]